MLASSPSHTPITCPPKQPICLLLHRLAAAALALALGQSREEARKVITLKEVEPLVEAKYRCRLRGCNTGGRGWRASQACTLVWRGDSNAQCLCVPGRLRTMHGKVRSSGTAADHAHDELHVFIPSFLPAADPRPAPAVRSWRRCRSCCTMVSAGCCVGVVSAARTAVCAANAPADACTSMNSACAPLYVKALLAMVSCPGAYNTGEMEELPGVPFAPCFDSSFPIVSCPGAYNTGEIEELLGVKLTELYEGNASALRVLGANGALRCGRCWAGCAGLRCGRLENREAKLS